MMSGSRHHLYCQAVLVWGLDDLDFDAWIDRGELTGYGKDEPVRIPASIADDVAKIRRKIEETGGF